jgi:hypothetical protein
VELLLNILWCTLVGAALAYLVRAHYAAPDRRRLLLGLGALLCAAALLFPAISITDDLHFDAFVVEDSNATKRLVSAITHASPVLDLAWFGFLGIALYSLLRRRNWRAANFVSSCYANPSLIPPLSGRAPPAKALA